MIEMSKTREEFQLVLNFVQFFNLKLFFFNSWKIQVSKNLGGGGLQPLSPPDFYGPDNTYCLHRGQISSYWIAGRPVTTATSSVLSGSIAKKMYFIICKNHANLYTLAICPTIMFTIASTNLLTMITEGTAKLHFMNSACVVIILLNTDLHRSAFSTYSSKKLVFRFCVFYLFVYII